MTARKKTIKVNASGLTANQWIAAVGAVPVLDLLKLYVAWERGEDPAKWRAHYASKGKVST